MHLILDLRKIQPTIHIRYTALIFVIESTTLIFTVLCESLYFYSLMFITILIRSLVLFIQVESLADRLELLGYTLSEDRQHVVIDMEEPESSEYEADSDWSDGVEEAEPIPAHDDDGYLSEGDKYREEEWG